MERLKIFLFFLRISSHHAVNKMTEHNLATVFAPTLIATPPHMTDLSQEIFMLTTLITHCVSVYGGNGAAMSTL